MRNTIIPPENGWKPQTLYLVDVALFDTNPIHRSVFFSGFLNGPDGNPGGYNRIWNPSSDLPGPEIHEVRFLRVVRELTSEGEATENLLVLAKDLEGPEETPQKPPVAEK